MVPHDTAPHGMAGDADALTKILGVGFDAETQFFYCRRERCLLNQTPGRLLPQQRKRPPYAWLKTKRAPSLSDSEESGRSPCARQWFQLRRCRRRCSAQLL